MIPDLFGYAILIIVPVAGALIKLYMVVGKHCTRLDMADRQVAKLENEIVELNGRVTRLAKYRDGLYHDILARVVRVETATGANGHKHPT